jgi:hypothetical protein
MSHSKEAFGALGGRTGWRDASRARRCPVCGHDSWCQLGAGEHSGVVLCKRVESERRKVNRSGVEYWVHRSDSTQTPVEPSTQARASDVTRAHAEVLDEAYRAALAALRLDDRHRCALIERGLSPSTIEARRYRTLPRGEARAAAGAAVVRAVGERDAMRVPGIVAGRWERNFWLAGASGLVVPSLDLCGRIVALKVRADDAAKERRYSAISSRAYGGPSAVANAHCPPSLRERLAHTARLYITEGELKADACAELGALAIVGLAGVGQWRAALALVEALAHDVALAVVAFDSDWQTKKPVRLARERLLVELAHAGFDARAASWPSEDGKGLDDVLVTRRRRACASEAAA